MRVCYAFLLCLIFGSLIEAKDLPVGLEGEPVDVFSEEDKDVVVLFFVEDICPISNRYIPKMKRLGERWSETARFLMVYPGVNTKVENVKEHRTDFEIGLPCVIDRDHVLVEKVDAKVTPECAVFARGESGAFEMVYRGRIDNQYVAFGKWRKEATVHDLRDTLGLIAKGEVPGFRSEKAIGCYIDRE
ncbi:redoxin domain-containing protein [Pelagicoccus mobilis]|uniref:Redoxin domain-containing protein n=1 Tax=Pelagicoccus mobilis TaxID=415221 RepID=A0A934RYH9_9BACT|nr:redoxin domain-containing protein [Pelagicoccus mobilis]MBK1879077.1 redoxin domain-containing protein [Pelagicoccus mobilis]